MSVFFFFCFLLFFFFVVVFSAHQGSAGGFRFDTLTELGAFMRTEFLCISVLRVPSGPE